MRQNHILHVLRPYPLSGPLLWPLAPCHWGTFLEAVVEIKNQLKHQEKSIEIAQLWLIVDHLHALFWSCPSSGVAGDSSEKTANVDRIYPAAIARVGWCYGCIMSAVSYLHEQRIYRNKFVPKKSCCPLADFSWQISRLGQLFSSLTWVLLTTACRRQGMTYHLKLPHLVQTGPPWIVSFRNHCRIF